MINIILMNQEKKTSIAIIQKMRIMMQDKKHVLNAILKNEGGKVYESRNRRKIWKNCS